MGTRKPDDETARRFGALAQDWIERRETNSEFGGPVSYSDSSRRRAYLVIVLVCVGTVAITTIIALVFSR